MRRFALALLFVIGLIVPAQAIEILTLPITTAVGPLTGPTFQLRFGPGVGAQNMTMQATLAYGSGGTTIDAWVQTSLDGGSTWADVARFNFTTAAARTVLNVTAMTAVAATVSAADGGVGGTALAVNTAVSGIFGNLWRVKYTTTGTYAGGTVLHIDAVAVGLTSSP